MTGLRDDCCFQFVHNSSLASGDGRGCRLRCTSDILTDDR
jgi:hypothetical protein